MEKKLGLVSVIATGVGLIVATSCLMSLGQGAGALGTGFIVAMVMACMINICTALSMAELNALMPNLTGGLAQYTLAGFGPFITIVTMVGGYLVCQSIAGSVECAMFGNAVNSVFHTGIPSNVLCIILLLILITANLMGIDMFAKIQNVVVYGLVLSLTIMGLLGILGLGSGEIVEQPLNLAGSFSDTCSMLGLAFFLFIGSEFVIPISVNVKNERRNIPLGMVLSLLIILLMQILVVCGMGRYCSWSELSTSASPHILYGSSLLGYAGSLWMILVSIFAVISTVNSAISFLSYMCAGMAKIELMPEIFLKKNRRGAYYVGVLLIGSIMVLVNATGLSTSDSLSFMITLAIVFWMVSYIIENCNVLIFRKRLPKAPRTFCVPFGPVIPILGIIGNLFMIWNIDGNPSTRNRIFLIDGIIFLLLAVYAAVWCKYKLKKPMFKPLRIHEVMAMENILYLSAHRKNKTKENENMGYPKVDLLYLNEDDMIEAGVRDMKGCVEAMEEMFRLMKVGDYRMGGANGNSHGSMVMFPEKSPFPEMPVDGPDRRFMAMPAYLGGKFDMAGVKWYGSNAANKEKGLPRSILMLILNDKDTGAPLAFMSANILSAYRTGAVPGVGFKYFAKQDAKTIGIVGPGVMSKTALAAAIAVRPSIKTVKVKGRGQASLQKFIEHAKQDYPGLDIYAVDSMEEAVRDSDIVSVSTSSPTGDPSLYPYIAEEWIKPGAIIESTAALRFDDDFLINRARTVTDNIMLYEAWEEEMKPNAYHTIPIPAVRVEDLIAEGRMKPEQIDDLGDVLLGNIPVHRKEDEIVIYSVGGMPTEDVAWGTMVYRNALKQGIGTKLNLWDTPKMMV